MNSSSALVASAVVVAILYFGQDILLPLGLAVLLSFALAPLVVRLRRLGVGRIPAVLVVVLAVTLLLSGAAVLVAGQLLTLANHLPRYQYNLSEKIHSVREAMPSGGTLERLSNVVRELGREIDESTSPSQTIGEATADGEIGVREPVPVELHERPPTAIETLQSVAGPLVQPLVTAGLIIVFVIFMLIERAELRDRLIRLIDERDLTRATKAIDDAAKRVSRYLLMQLLVALAHGIPYGIGLWLIGVPSPLLWGMLAAALRFIPYVGPVVAAILPLTLALAVDPGWSMVLATVGLIVVLELFTNNVLEPWLYGSTTGLSPVAILVAAVFWTTLWGPIGLLLSVPLTVCFVVLGRHVPQLAFLDLLLGDRPALTLQERIYQRLLAGDRHEATELAEAFEVEQGPIELADQVLLPVLRLAEQDRERRTLDFPTQERIASLVEDVSSYLAEADPLEFDPPGEAGPVADVRPRVLCVGGRHSLDLASAAVLARALETAGIDAKVLLHTELRPGALGDLVDRPPAIVCVTYLSPPSPQHARRLRRRVHATTSNDVGLVACSWYGEGPPLEADLAVSTVQSAVTELRARLGLPPLPAAEPAAPAASGLPAPATANA